MLLLHKEVIIELTVIINVALLVFFSPDKATTPLSKSVGQLLAPRLATIELQVQTFKEIRIVKGFFIEF